MKPGQYSKPCRYLVFSFSFLIPAFAIASQVDLTALSLEELMNAEVVSVSKTEEKGITAPAAITVITADDIRRLGATSLPDVLRMSAGLHVAQVSSNEWAVASRGFSSVNSAKLLVLIDGRSVYTPLFSGVFWDVQDTMLADIDRIEVIRGPGAALWGANAMNGVINIITKSAADTQGVHAEVGGGTHDRVFGAIRYGGGFSEALKYRIYGKFFDRTEEFNPDPSSQDTDAWNMGRVGFRTDWKLGESDSLTFQGDVYLGDVGQVQPSVVVLGRPSPSSPLDVDVSGGHGMLNWRKTLGRDSDIRLGAYYDRTHRDDPSYVDDLDTYDLHFQHRLPLPWSQELIWGAEYRLMVNENRGKGVFSLAADRSADRLYSGFVQDRIGLDENFQLTLGSKFEQNDFSGFELQPSARFSWELAKDNTLWGSISRAARVPTRIERDVDIVLADPASDPLPVLVGNSDLKAEKMNSVELGFRSSPVRSVVMDLAVFFNRYTNLVTLEMGDPFVNSTGTTIIPIRSENEMIGNARGAEISAAYEPRKGSWRLSTTYTHFLLQLKPHKSDINGARRSEGATPSNQFTLLGHLPFSDRFKFDAFFRYVGKLDSTADVAGEWVPDFAEVDARFEWNISSNYQLALVGQNLLHDRHLEFPGGTLMERAFYVRLTASI